MALRDQNSGIGRSDLPFAGIRHNAAPGVGGTAECGRRTRYEAPSNSWFGVGFCRPSALRCALSVCGAADADLHDR